VYSLVFIAISVVIFALLVQINLVLGLLFFTLAVVSLPATVIHRREAQTAPEFGPDAESHGEGLLRFFRIVGLDTGGIALGILLLILIVVLARRMAVH
jgi:hypothetical protein